MLGLEESYVLYVEFLSCIREIAGYRTKKRRRKEAEKVKERVEAALFDDRIDGDQYDELNDMLDAAVERDWSDVECQRYFL